MILQVSWNQLWSLSFGLSQSHGHGSWLMCEVALRRHQTTTWHSKLPHAASNLQWPCFDTKYLHVTWKCVDVVPTIPVVQGPYRSPRWRITISQHGRFSFTYFSFKDYSMFLQPMYLAKVWTWSMKAELVQIRYYLLLIWILTGRSGSVLPLTYINRSIRAFLGSHRTGEEQIIRFRQSKEQLTRHA